MFETHHQHLDLGVTDLAAFRAENAADAMRRVNHEIILLKGFFGLFCHQSLLTHSKPGDTRSGQVALDA